MERLGAHGEASLAFAVQIPSPQSALEPAGRDAERIASLFPILFGGGAAIWLVVMGLTVYAVVLRDRRHQRDRTRRWVVGGGAFATTALLGLLLVRGLSAMPELLDPGAPGGPKIRVSGEQWWWRVRYELPDGASFELANELWLPRGRRMPLLLESPDVIHSFWLPSLGGKIDVIPGRVNRLGLEPTRTGTFTGVCAEYCGLSHARMLFHVVVVEPPAFEAWLAAQRADARAPAAVLAQRGHLLFQQHGCGACHAVRGTAARGAVGPDLTHVGGRVSVAAGTVANDVAGFEEWLARTEALKPGVHMPSFHMLSSEERNALATWLDGLQ
ncbi:MAG: c-type cytochrome [Deltaproteobacteria bacterium]|nr:c-type cytochrome [Deltaproteobacteria bacterium]